MSQFLFKRGDTFVMTADITDASGAPINLTGATMLCQVRDALDDLIAELVVTQDATVSNRMQLSFAGPTTAWPLGTMRGDIEITQAAGSINTSETFRIAIVDRITTG